MTGTIREGKDPREIDRRIIERYGLAISKFTRARRKKSGTASVQYLRHERFFILLATHGKHRFFDEEDEIKDAREAPIRYEGYSVSVRAGRSCVRIDRGTYLNLKAYFEDIAAKRSVETLSKQLRGLPFSPLLRSEARSLPSSARSTGLVRWPVSRQCRSRSFGFGVLR